MTSTPADPDPAATVTDRSVTDRSVTGPDATTVTVTVDDPDPAATDPPAADRHAGDGAGDDPEVRPHRVAILGGGIAALTTAYWLTRPELEGRFEVTVHQLGWRLGGKLASAREGPAQRNVEHGLHVWFGCYDNAFAMAEDVYRHFPRPDGFPWERALDAFLPQRFTPIGEVIGGRHTFWDFTWPTSPGVPGEGPEVPGPVEVLGELAAAVLRAFERLLHHHGASPPAVPDEHRAAAPPELAAHADHHTWLRWATQRFQAGDHHAAGLRHVLATVHRHAVPHLDPSRLDTSDDVDAHHLRNAVDVGLAVLEGVLDPADHVTDDFDLDRIDDREFRTWLVDHGADVEVVARWSFLTALYDTMFQYREGDHERPDYAAGTALRAFLRIALTYKGAVMYLVKAGMGEVVIAPLYELLRERGVTFRFFHAVRRLELSDDQQHVERVRIDVQAELVDPDTPYPATEVTDDGLVVWRDQPVWDALVDGEALREQLAAAHTDLESRWGQPAPARHLTLTRGEDLDTVVLGISLGGFMPLGDDEGLTAELGRADPAWRAMTEHLGLVPSVSTQLWLDPSLEELGWHGGKPAAVGWTVPNEVWADMSQVLATEDWGEDGPRSLHYLCGVLGTDLFRRPADDPDVPDVAARLARDRTVEQLDRDTATIWPAASRPDGGLDWSHLHDPEGRTGIARLDAQVIRANVTPTECCVGSHTGTTRYRLRADGSAFANLVLCGAWTRTGLNSTCVEAAVMSGMAAARAIGGVPATIVGESFLGPTVPVGAPLAGAASAGGRASGGGATAGGRTPGGGATTGGRAPGGGESAGGRAPGGGATTGGRAPGGGESAGGRAPGGGATPDRTGSGGDTEVAG